MTSDVFGDMSSKYERGFFSAISSSMAMVFLDTSGNVCGVNDNFLNIIGYERQDVLGCGLHAFCVTDDESDTGSFWQGLLSGASFTQICELRHRSGTSRWLEAICVPVHNENKQICGILKFGSDITPSISHEYISGEHGRRLSMAIDATDAGILLCDPNGSVTYANAGFTRLFGWRIEDLAGRSPYAMLASHLTDAEQAASHAQILQAQKVQREEVVLGRDGQRFWVSNTSQPVLDAEGRLVFTISLINDITSAKLHEVLQHRVLEAMAQDLPLIRVLELVCHEVERFAPDVTCSILAVDEETGRLRPLASPSLPADYSDALNGLLIGPNVGSCGTSIWRNEQVIVSDIETDPLWADYRHLILPFGYRACWSVPIRTSEGRIVGTFGCYFKSPGEPTPFHQQMLNTCSHLCALAMEREQARQKIHQLAFYDGLTGLANRKQLLARADKAIAAATCPNDSLAVFILDIDRFRQINDALGHIAGDTLLRYVADRLKREFQPAGFCGRLSGDEFIAILPHASLKQVMDLAERLQNRISEPFTYEGDTIIATASIGIAMFPADGQNMEVLLQYADMAMHQAKRAGLGRFCFFSPEMNKIAQEGLVQENALRAALRNGTGLRLHYQPQINLQTGQVLGVEALSRWTLPDGTDIPPSRFIPLAEECGLVAELGLWALREACQQIAQWRAQGLDIPSVSVNLSPTSFHNLGLPLMIGDVLVENGLRPDDLTIEITENVLLDTNPTTLQTIHQIHAIGVRLSMDDFGVGYSSLGYLQRLPIHEIKLDRSFVANLEADQTARKLSEAVLRIGESLQLQVIAEGVETAFQREMLIAQGYHAAQGYLFAHPMAADKLSEWIGTGPF